MTDLEQEVDVFVDLCNVETIFEGDSDYDYQFEIYKMMRRENGLVSFFENFYKN
jgi:hypothetical protein